MRGEILAVWPNLWREVWLRVAVHDDAKNDMFCELFRELTKGLKTPPSEGRLAEIVNDPRAAKRAFRNASPDELRGESAALTFLEDAYDVLDDFGGAALAQHYFATLLSFVDRFSLRYDLSAPCRLCPTIPGIFTSLLRDLRELVDRDPHLHCLMAEFEAAVRDLRIDRTESRIKTCIQKQTNLLEGLARSCPGVTRATLGAMCDELKVWPHDSVRDGIKNLYKFASDYPGLRHGGMPGSARRPIDMRDLVAVSILMVGYVPYLTGLDSELVYSAS